MTFIEIINRNIEDRNRRHGLRGEVIVNARALQDLMDDYNRLDSAARAEHFSRNEMRENIHRVLHESIIAAYHQNDKDTDRTLAVIMDTLLVLIKEKQKQQSLAAFLR